MKKSDTCYYMSITKEENSAFVVNSAASPNNNNNSTATTGNTGESTIANTDPGEKEINTTQTTVTSSTGGVLLKGDNVDGTCHLPQVILQVPSSPTYVRECCVPIIRPRFS